MAQRYTPPVKVKTVEYPYRTAVLRADPTFEYARRHEPFYEFSNNRRFDGDTKRHGAYNYIPVNASPVLAGVEGDTEIGHIFPQTDAGLFVSLTGVAAQAQLGAIDALPGSFVPLAGIAATGALGVMAINFVFPGTGNLVGVAAASAAGVITTSGTQSVSLNLTGVAASSGVGLVNALHSNLVGIAATAGLGTITPVVGNTSASPNVGGVTATGALGAINQGQLQQPIMTLTSAAGVSDPTFTFTLDPNIVAGDTMTYQEQVDGGDWSSPTVNVTHTFTSGEIAANAVDLALASRTNGTWDARMKVTHVATSVTSAWSNSIVFTVSVGTSGTPFGLLLAITK